MKAINLSSGKEYEVHQPDKYTNQVMTADYWTEIDGKTLLLVELNGPVQEGHEYRCYRIENKIYQGIWTNSHDELVKMYRGKPEQIRLF